MRGQTEPLIAALKECEALLRGVGEHFWADKIAAVLGETSGPLAEHRICEVISWFGGMGSFNDLVISTLNGHSFEAPD